MRKIDVSFVIARELDPLMTYGDSVAMLWS